jgi:hypothetical protein
MKIAYRLPLMYLQNEEQFILESLLKKMIMFFSTFFANIDQNKTKDGRKIFGCAKFANLCHNTESHASRTRKKTLEKMRYNSL